MLGEFTDDGFLHVTYGEKTVACIDMEFLHDGLPEMISRPAGSRPSTTSPRVRPPRIWAPCCSGFSDG